MCVCANSSGGVRQQRLHSRRRRRFEAAVGAYGWWRFGQFGQAKRTVGPAVRRAGLTKVCKVIVEGVTIDVAVEAENCSNKLVES